MRKLAFFLSFLLALLPVAALAEEQIAPLPEGTRVVTIASGHEPDALPPNENAPDGLLASAADNVTMVHSLAQALLMLSADQADAFFLFYDTMRYVESRNTDYLSVPDSVSVKLHLLALNDKTELMDGVDAALTSMEEDGTSAAIWQAHVEDVITGADPTPLTLPAAEEGKPTFIVGVSGDCPPIDYTTPDGQAAGYNVAMLSVIAARTGFGFELVTIESGARYAALTSGRIDLFFWQQTMDEISEEITGAENGASASAMQLLGDEYRLSVPYAKVLLGFLMKREG